MCNSLLPRCREVCGVGFSGMTSLLFRKCWKNRIACAPKYTPGGNKQLLSPILQRAIELKPEDWYASQGNALFKACEEKNTPCEIVAVNYMCLTGHWQHTMSHSPSSYIIFTVVQFYYMHKLNIYLNKRSRKLMPLMSCATWWIFHDMSNKITFYAANISFDSVTWLIWPKITLIICHRLGSLLVEKRDTAHLFL